MKAVNQKLQNDFTYYEGIFMTIKRLYSNQDFRNKLLDEDLEIEIDDDASIYFGNDQFFISRKSIDLHGKPHIGPEGSLKHFSFTEQFFQLLVG